MAANAGTIVSSSSDLQQQASNPVEASSQRRKCTVKFNKSQEIFEHHQNHGGFYADDRFTLILTFCEGNAEIEGTFNPPSAKIGKTADRVSLWSQFVRDLSEVTFESSGPLSDKTTVDLTLYCKGLGEGSHRLTGFKKVLLGDKDVITVSLISCKELEVS